MNCYNYRGARLPNIRKLRIIFTSEDDIQLKEFMENCIPDMLESFTFKYNGATRQEQSMPTARKLADISKYMPPLTSLLPIVSKTIRLEYIEFFDSLTFNSIIQACHKTKNIMIYWSSVSIYEACDFNPDLEYKTKILSF